MDGRVECLSPDGANSKIFQLRKCVSWDYSALYLNGLSIVLSVDPEKVRYKVIGVEMKGMESSMKLVALGATQRRG